MNQQSKYLKYKKKYLKYKKKYSELKGGHFLFSVSICDEFIIS